MAFTSNIKGSSQKIGPVASLNVLTDLESRANSALKNTIFVKQDIENLRSLRAEVSSLKGVTTLLNSIATVIRNMFASVKEKTDNEKIKHILKSLDERIVQEQSVMGSNSFMSVPADKKSSGIFYACRQVALELERNSTSKKFESLKVEKNAIIEKIVSIDEQLKTITSPYTKRKLNKLRLNLDSEVNQILIKSAQLNEQIELLDAELNS